MYLLANENGNYIAWKFYKTRGFEAAASDTKDKDTDSEAASKPDTEVIQEFIDHPILSSFVLNEANTLKLMCQNNFDSFQFGSPSAAKTHPCFLLDPQRPKHVEEVNDPMVYAQFPGKLSLKEMNHCGKDMFLLQQPGTFQVHDDGPIGILKGFPKSQFVVSWASAASWNQTGITILNPSVSLFIAWVQRDCEAPIWKDRVTLVPTCVMIPLWNTYFLLQRYLSTHVYIGGDVFAQELSKATFDPMFDNERFMEHAKEVMVYIFANWRELFAKPYIVMFGENLNMD